jgi:hypothetical protein
MEKQILPTKQGQIVRSLIPLDGIETHESFILGDDPSLFNDSELVVIYSVTEFLRCQARGEKPFGNKIKLNCSSVLGDDLKSWVESWNNS